MYFLWVYSLLLVGKKNPTDTAGFLKNMAPTYSPGTNPSTIGHEGLNYSVRYGKRWTPSAKAP